MEVILRPKLMRSMTSSVACLHPLDMCKLPAFLPAVDPTPHLYPLVVYARLKKIKSSKSSGPDEFPPKLVKEFAHELSVPLTDILNSSFNEGVVPVQWKDAIVVPIPKQFPPSLDKLRPVSLTSVFAKLAEGFVSDWILDDVHSKIDLQQFGTVKGVSTNHYLNNLIHYLYYGAEGGRNVGTVVLTDFSKAFDLVDHTLLINKIISIGVRGSIVPWICDFLRNRRQCVRYKYNNVLSDYVGIQGGIPQGTKFGPIGFQILINDAAQNSQSKYWKYVDDLTFAENSKISSRSHMQEDLDNFKEWSDANHLQLKIPPNARPSRCVSIIPINIPVI